jgi:hypothetical protein
VSSLCELCSQKAASLADLNDGLLRTALASIAKKAAVNDEQAIALLVDAVRNPQCRVPIPKKTMVNTRSNLRFEVLVEIFESLGFPLGEFETKGPLINFSLCDAR